jgi:hypothetical protein
MADLSLPLLFTARRLIVSAIEDVPDNLDPRREPTLDVMLNAVAAALKVIDKGIIDTIATTPDELAAQLTLLHGFYSDEEEVLCDQADAPALIATISLGVRELTEGRPISSP